MQTSRAGPSSPPALASSATSPPRRGPTSTAAAEPYDSPLKAVAESEASTYGAGGQETDVAEADEGGDLGVRAAVRTSPERSKGKGRAIEPDYAHVRTRSGDVVLDMHPDPENDDEAAEERRIQENLARWSRADSNRRASLRRSAKLVMPSLPSSPPVSLPSPTSLVRRTSTLLRSGRKGRGSNDISGLQAEDVELGAEGVAGRRGRQKLSVQLGVGQDPPGPQDGHRDRAEAGGLSRVGEEEGDEGDNAPAPADPTQHAYPADSAPLATPTSIHTTDPFSPSNASFVSLESTATDRTARTGSRFIEDLPTLPFSPPSTATTPHASPTKRASSAQPTNPFLDVVVTSPTPTRPNVVSRVSQSTLHSLTTTSAASVLSVPPPRTPSPAWHSADESPLSSPGLGASPSSAYAHPGSKARQRCSPRPQRAAAMDERYGAWAADGYGGARGFDHDDEIGLLDWLLCGCFRAGGGQRDERIEQQGRTNPME